MSLIYKGFKPFMHLNISIARRRIRLSRMHNWPLLFNISSYASDLSQYTVAWVNTDLWWVRIEIYSRFIDWIIEVSLILSEMSLNTDGMSVWLPTLVVFECEFGVPGSEFSETLTTLQICCCGVCRQQYSGGLYMKQYVEAANHSHSGF